MPEAVPFVHPYIPNSAPEVRAEMLRAIGVADADELFRDIPEALRFRGRLRLPEALLSEAELRRHGEELLRRNVPATRMLSFLGAGCYQHYVPAVCDELAQRAEFLTEYAGETYSAKGKFQALFECSSTRA
jgi:glycine dehydrogenase subunit 1